MLDEKRGRVIGGSSSINAMIFNRGNPLDYDGWAAQGLPDWRWKDCLPYFKKMESFPSGDSEWRGKSGPLFISRCAADFPLYHQFLRAGEQAGFSVSSDHNGQTQEGFHIAQAYIHAGLRWSASRAYLRPSVDRPNLQIRSRTAVSSITFEGNRATGVVTQHAGREERIECVREVILSAGAFGSPQLLMLSGIGDPAHLREHGIKVRLPLPDVGLHLENHPGVNLQFATDARHSIVSRLGFLDKMRMGLEWALLRRGMGSTNFFEAGAFLRTRPEVEFPNVQFEFLPLVRYVEQGRLKARPGFNFWMDLSRPASRGRVRLRSPDSGVAPSIVFNHLAEKSDLEDLIDGILLGRQIVRQSALSSLSTGELLPGAHIQSRADLRLWVQANLGTSYHPSGTCRMGRGPGSVVDAQGLVHGTSALRVVDGSIMPLTVTANISAAIYMLAEKIADAIRGRPALSAKLLTPNATELSTAGQSLGR